jgi:hypothetical protein
LDRWGNIYEDIVWNSLEIPLVNLLTRMVPISIPIEELSIIISILLIDTGEYLLEMSRDSALHGSPDIINIPKKLLEIMVKRPIVRRNAK